MLDMYHVTPLPSAAKLRRGGCDGAGGLLVPCWRAAVVWERRPLSEAPDCMMTVVLAMRTPST
jgi:hypothetical protein